MSADPSSRERIEVVSWVLLAAASLASAWCAYQASLWSGEQTRSLARASVAQFASLRKTTIANRDLTVDVGMVIHYVVADLHGDAKVAGFLRHHVRPTLKPALEAWIADRASGDVDAPNPFKRPEYRIPEWDEALALDRFAASALAQANAANANNDTYLLHTVLFALSLFLLGGTTQVRRRGAQRAMLALGALAFTATMISLVRLPREPWHPADKTDTAAPDAPLFEGLKGR